MHACFLREGSDDLFDAIPRLSVHYINKINPLGGKSLSDRRRAYFIKRSNRFLIPISPYEGNEYRLIATKKNRTSYINYEISNLLCIADRLGSYSRE